jgi:16S rRNA (cytidine1402-2'-O)-methyltransferase
MAGKVFFVPTPIGNLEDITLRSLETLKKVDIVYCEDTRVTGKLLHHFEIDKPLRSFHQNNEHHLVDKVVEDISNGQTIAYCSDAGTPGISDPGFLLAKKAIEHGIEIDTLPGATAFVPALVNSGIPCDRFVFEGFLPVKKGRKTKLESLQDEMRTIVLYESPHKLLRTLNDILNYWGDRKMSISREITKMFEETVRGHVSEVISHFEQKPPKGEFVIIIEGHAKK